MSLPREEIIYNIARAIRRTASSSVLAEIAKWLNYEYFEICKAHPWHALRRKTTIDFTGLGGSDETGLYLPQNMLGIERVRDATNDIEFVPRNHSDAYEPDESPWRYYTHYPSMTPAFRAEDLALSTDATSFTSADLTADGTDYTGDWVRFGNELGLYELTSALGFDPAYRGPTMTAENFQIRPPDMTQKMIILDPDESILRDRSVEVYYWIAPEPLYDDSDMPVLPITRPLELKVLITVLGTIGKRQITTDRYRGEYQDALDEAKTLNPDFARSSRPRDVHNNIFDMSKVYFGDRTNTTATELRYMLRREW